MGNGSSKKKYAPSLTAEQRESIRALIDIRGPEKGQAITADFIKNVWKDILSDGLLQTFLTFLFRDSKTITIEEFEMFFYNMVEAPIDDRAQTIVACLGIDSTIPPRSMQTFVSDLLQSYLMILRQKVPSAYSSWVTGDLTQKSDVNIISQFFIRDINYVDGRLHVEELERWLRVCGFVKDLSETVVKVAFGIEVEELKPTLPKANKFSSLLRIPTVLTLSHFTRDCSKEWRLLYSSVDEAHSWNILQNRLFGEGPTLVLIQDTAGPLLGGFASQTWKNGPHFYGDENCFLFRLRPELRLCFPTGYNSNFQYMNSGATTLPNGLGMGGQLNYFGFFLSSEFGPGSVSKTCTTFRDYIPLASQLEFFFSRLEVWAIGEPDAVEENVRQVHVTPSGLVMQRDPGAAALLEMAGRTGYSKHVQPQDLGEEN